MILKIDDNSPVSFSMFLLVKVVVSSAWRATDLANEVYCSANDDDLKKLIVEST
jgi:hypothetical protein